MGEQAGSVCPRGGSGGDLDGGCAGVDLADCFTSG